MCKTHKMIKKIMESLVIITIIKRHYRDNRPSDFYPDRELIFLIKKAIMLYKN